MTPKERAVMQQALEALEKYNSKHRHTYGLDGAWDEEITKGERSITALREALAEQAEQEPVVMDESWCLEPQPVNGLLSNEQAEQEPVAWMHKCGGVCSADDKEHMFGFDYFNIPLYAAQQPVQDIMEAVDAAMAEMQNINPPLRRSECERLIRAANYAAPVRTKDLTDDEIAEIVTELDSKLIMRDATELEIARAVIAAYKEKNK